MEDTVQVQCPYCFQLQELFVDPATSGEMVQDCDVCCRPWQVHVARDAEGNPIVHLTRAQ